MQDSIHGHLMVLGCIEIGSFSIPNGMLQPIVQISDGQGRASKDLSMVNIDPHASSYLRIEAENLVGIVYLELQI
jgi:hypothetical protein